MIASRSRLLAPCALIAMVATCCVAGCGGAYVRPDPLRELRERVARETSCDVVTVAALGNGDAVARGCGREATYHESCTTMGCKYWPLPDVVARAAFDLNCDAAVLSQVRIDASTLGIRGCGRRATYTLLCASDGCTWLPGAISEDSVPQPVQDIRSTSP